MGESALLVDFGDSLGDAANAWALALTAELDRAPPPGLRDLVPASRSLTLHFDPLQMCPQAGDARPVEQLCRLIGERLAGLDARGPVRAREVEIPVSYGGSAGEDLAALAAAHGFTEAELVARHCAPLYRVDMLGFLPGFAYLRGLDPALHTPRRSAPRDRVPAGSLAIGGGYTAVYPVSSPGGWHLIGQTPVVLFDPTADPPTLLRPGDRVRFRPVEPEAVRVRS